MVIIYLHHVSTSFLYYILGNVWYHNKYLAAHQPVVLVVEANIL